MEINRVKINQMYQPVGISGEGILVSWNLSGTKKQRAFQIFAEGSLGSSFDSGIREEDKMFYMFPGKFRSRERVQVTVQVWEVSEGADGAKSSKAHTFFEVGITPEDWRARWILPEQTAPGKGQIRPGSYLKKTFSLSRIKDARLYVTSHGIYNVWLNKKHVDGCAMAPGTSEYHKRLQYQTYDVTELLRSGENELLVSLGDGWWRGTVTYNGILNGFGEDVALLLQLENDKEPVCISGEGWQATQEGPLRGSDNMAGEIYDARREDWLRQSQIWHEVQEADFGYGNICSSNCPPPKEQERFAPKLLVTPNGEQVLDFGQNIAGYISFDIEEEEGRALTFTHGETLDKAGNFMMENFQSPAYWCAQRIRYICRAGKNRYRPRHTFMGFRYVKVEGMSRIDPADFCAHAVYTDLEQTAEFSSGNELVNRLFSNSLWSLKGNLLDMPTDCPTREKSGFTGDLTTYIYTMLYLMDAYPMAVKFMDNLQAGQYEDGCIKQVAATPEERGWFDGAAGWCDAYEIIPDRIWERYGHDTLFASHYEGIRRWVDYILARAAEQTRPENVSHPYAKWFEDSGIHWGEWAEPGMDFPVYLKQILDHGEPEVGTAYLSYACRLLSKHAHLLGKEEEAAYYENQGEQARKAYRHSFLDADGRIHSPRMCRYIRPIVLDLLTEEEKRQAAADLDQLVRKNQYRLNTGFLTTHELCRTLSDYGYTGTAYRLLLNEEAPGWLYSVKQGATTILENWYGFGPDGERKDSFNHYSYGAITGWLMDTAAGIRIREGKLFLEPKPCKKLGHIRCSYLAPFGKVESSWEYLGDRIRFSFEIPGNTAAMIRLPDGQTYEAGCGRHVYETAELKL